MTFRFQRNPALHVNLILLSFCVFSTRRYITLLASSSRGSIKYHRMVRNNLSVTKDAVKICNKRAKLFLWTYGNNSRNTWIYHSVIMCYKTIGYASVRSFVRSLIISRRKGRTRKQKNKKHRITNYSCYSHAKNEMICGRS